MKSFIASIIRHQLTALGGVLIGVGIEHSDAQAFVLASEPIATGLVLFILGQGWSFFNITTIKSLAAKWGIKL